MTPLHELLHARRAIVVVGPVVFAFVMALAASRNRAVRRFLREKATRPGAAIGGESFRRVESWWLARLAAADVVRDDGHGRVWLDEQAWAAYRARRRTRAIAAVAILTAGMAVLWLTGVIGGPPR